MRPAAATVFENLTVVAPGLFEGIAEDGEAGMVEGALGKAALLVGFPGQPPQGGPVLFG
jgi:hypothetical protein